jgi:hypothetical protein
MPEWPNLFRIWRFRFNARVDRELARRENMYEDHALENVLADLERTDLRSHYREVLQAVAQRLRRRRQKAQRRRGGLIPFVRRPGPRKSSAPRRA